MTYDHWKTTNPAEVQDDATGREIEHADSIGIAMCPQCEFPHLLMKDIGGNIIAEAKLSRESCEDLLRFLHAYMKVCGY